MGFYSGVFNFQLKSLVIGVHNLFSSFQLYISFIWPTHQAPFSISQRQPVTSSPPRAPLNRSKLHQIYPQNPPRRLPLPHHYPASRSLYSLSSRVFTLCGPRNGSVTLSENPSYSTLSPVRDYRKCTPRHYAAVTATKHSLEVFETKYGEDSH